LVPEQARVQAPELALQTGHPSAPEQAEPRVPALVREPVREPVQQTDRPQVPERGLGLGQVPELGQVQVPELARQMDHQSEQEQEPEPEPEVLPALEPEQVRVRQMGHPSRGRELGQAVLELERAPEQVLGPEQVPRQTDQLGPGPGQEPERVQVLRRVLHQPDRPVPAR
jgi:hypothetical protein